MLTQPVARKIEEALRGLRYGAVQLIVHEQQVVRIERVERIRLTGTPEAETTTPDGPTATPERP